MRSSCDGFGLRLWGDSACALETGNDPALDRLNEFAAMVQEEKARSFGYPGNQDVQLTEFYR